jgi:hypothetical protein
MKHYPPTWGSTFKTLIGCLSFVVGVLSVAVALYLGVPLAIEWVGYLYCNVASLFGLDCLAAVRAVIQW